MFKKKHEDLYKVNHGKGIFNKFFFSVVFFVLIIYAAALLGLLLWALMTAMKDEKDLLNGNVFGLPDVQTYGWDSLWKNFGTILNNFHIKSGSGPAPVTDYYTVFGTHVHYEVDANFFTMALNSLIYAGGGAILQAFIPAIVAYVLSKYKFKFSKVVYAIALITYIIPIVGNAPSMLAMLKNLGFYDSWFGYFFMKFNFSGMYFFIFYSFFQGLPDSYIEAAELDGANQLQIMTRVVFPYAKKTIFTVILIVFVQLWNDYQTPLLYLPTLPTLSYGVWYFSNYNINGLTSTPIRMASTMSMALPIILLFIFLKDRLMGNVSLGGLKE